VTASFSSAVPRTAQKTALIVASGGETRSRPIPGEYWLADFRLYAPTEVYFNRRWPLPDIEKVK